MFAGILFVTCFVCDFSASGMNNESLIARSAEIDVLRAKCQSSSMCWWYSRCCFRVVVVDANNRTDDIIAVSECKCVLFLEYTCDDGFFTCSRHLQTPCILILSKEYQFACDSFWIFQLHRSPPHMYWRSRAPTFGTFVTLYSRFSCLPKHIDCCRIFEPKRSTINIVVVVVIIIIRELKLVVACAVVSRSFAICVCVCGCLYMYTKHTNWVLFVAVLVVMVFNIKKCALYRWYSSSKMAFPTSRIIAIYSLERICSSTTTSYFLWTS